LLTKCLVSRSVWIIGFLPDLNSVRRTGLE
jgi:hypothetical protein